MYRPLKESIIEIMKKFTEDFEHNEMLNGHHYTASFENGYGISIIKHDGSYGKVSDKWEIAVLKGDELCYDTPVTNDVIGWLTDEEVLKYFFMIENLPKESEYVGRHRGGYSN